MRTLLFDIDGTLALTAEADGPCFADAYQAVFHHAPERTLTLPPAKKSPAPPPSSPKLSRIRRPVAASLLAERGPRRNLNSVLWASTRTICRAHTRTTRSRALRFSSTPSACLERDRPTSSTWGTAAGTFKPAGLWGCRLSESRPKRRPICCNPPARMPSWPISRIATHFGRPSNAQFPLRPPQSSRHPILECLGR